MVGMVAVVTMAVVTVVVVRVVVGNVHLLIEPLLELTLTLKVVLSMVVLGVVVVVVVVVVMMMMVVVVLVAVMLGQIVFDLGLEALIDEFLELDALLVVLDGTDELVIETILQPEPELITLQLVLEFPEDLVRVVVTVMTVVVTVVAVMMEVMSVMTMVVVGMHVVDGDINVDFLNGGVLDVGGVLVVSVVMVMMRMNRDLNIIGLPGGSNIIGPVEISMRGSLDHGGGGEAEESNRDDLGLHFDCSCGWRREFEG